MGTVTAKLFNQIQFGYVEHTSVSGETWQLISKGTTTSAGASNGTTIIDASSPSGGADTYNGRYWVHILSGTQLGQWKRIVDDNGSGTLTLENNGFPGQVATSVQYEIWKSPEPVIVVDSSSGETDIVDAVRSESVNSLHNFWEGYYVIPITGTYRGKTGLIVGHTPGTGTFVLAAGLGGALAAGDVCLLRKHVEVSSLNLPKGHEYIKRPMTRVNFSVGDGVVGARSGELSFSTWVYGSGALSAAEDYANPGVLSGMFGAVGLEEYVGKSAEITTGSTTTAIKILTGKWENLTIGQLVEWNGNIRRITAQTDGGGSADTITVSPPLPYAPTAGDVLHGMRCYQKSTDGDGLYGICVDVEIDGVRHTITGCKGSVDLVDGPVMQLNWKFQCDHWIRDNEASAYYPTYTTVAPCMSHDRLAWMGTTEVAIKGFTATPGTANVRKKVQGSSNGINGGAGFHMTDYNAGCTFKQIVASDSDNAHDLAFDLRTSYAMLVVFGSHGQAMAISIPAARLVASPHPENADGLMEVPYNMSAQDAGTTSNPTPTVVKIPDFSICLT